MSPLRLFALAAATLAGGGIFLLPQYLIAQPSEPAVPTDRAAIEQIVRDYLLANPEILREMAGRLEEKDKAAAQAAREETFKTAAAEIYNSEHQVVLGNPKGDVTLVEFFDYNCGYCKQALADTNELLKSDPNLRLVLKELPFLGQDSVDAARVAIAVSKQAPDKYLDFHRQLLSSDSASGSIAIEIARDLGLDMKKVSADIAAPKTEEALIESRHLANQLGITGTPTYVIADTILPGALGADNLKEIIGSVRQCGKAQC